VSWSRLDLGVGLIAAEGLDLFWPALADQIDVIEVEPQTLWDHTCGDGRSMAPAALQWLRTRDRPLLSHGVGFPVGGTVPPDLQGVRASARAAWELDAVQWSEHLSFNRASSPLRNAGYLLPPIPTAETVTAAVSHIAVFQDLFDRPFLVETPASYLTQVETDLRDGQFVAEIAERADCGILLDLHNIWANELNGRQSVAEFLADIPLDRVWEVHLAGGHYLDSVYLDAHIGPIPPPLLDIARTVVPRLPRVRAVLFEAVPESLRTMGAQGLAAVLRQLREIASEPQCPAIAGRSPGNAPVPTGPSTAKREAELVAFTTRASGDDAIGDAGARVLRYLTDQARLSLLVASHPLELRQLLLTYGRDRTDRLLEDFLASTPASQWPHEQSEAFTAWLADHPDLPVGEAAIRRTRLLAPTATRSSS
jgi:uncharacterized protein (UPF0276 family)